MIDLKPTCAGIVAIAASVAGEKLTFTRFGVGDGKLGLNEEEREKTALSNELFAVDIAEFVDNKDGTITVAGVFTSDQVAQDFTYREVGLYATVGDNVTPVLMAYGNAGDSAEYIPAWTDGESGAEGATFIEKKIKIQIIVGNTAKITAKIDPETLATIGYVDAKITPGRNVGDIFYTSRLDTELNGAVEANGATYNVTDFRGEHSVPELLKAGKLPFVSLAEFADLVATNGSCRAFGYDGGYSFRVPKLNDVYLMAGTAETAGEFINESLPNLKGYFAQWKAERSDGVLFKSTAIGAISNSNDGGADGSWRTDFDASAYSSAYKDGAKVRPDSVKYRAMVQLATGTTQEALITATSAIQQVANKIDRQGNDTVVETYRNGNSWYRIYSDGWCEQGGYVVEDGTTHRIVYFPVPFKDKPTKVSYNLGILENANYDQRYFCLTCICDLVTNEKMNVFTKTGNNDLKLCTGFWEAKGYIR